MRRVDDHQSMTIHLNFFLFSSIYSAAVESPLRLFCLLYLTYLPTAADKMIGLISFFVRLFSYTSSI